MAIRVKDFGAVGDGITDDTAAIQAAADAAAEAGEQLYFDPGTYNFGLITLKEIANGPSLC